jgi:hypothetical protein
MKEIHSEMEDHAREAVNDKLFSSTVQAFDEIATHHQVYGCNIDHLNLLEMGPDTIKFNVTGSVDCQLQRSDGDYSRGDGLRVDDNYPFTCELVADIATPLDLKITALEVDNSSFYG